MEQVTALVLGVAGGGTFDHLRVRTRGREFGAS
jgi:hypothetical protein